MKKQRAKAPTFAKCFKRLGKAGKISMWVFNIFLIGLIHMQLTTLGKCRFRSSGGFVKPRRFLARSVPDDGGASLR